jgi:hypothetical protein
MISDLTFIQTFCYSGETLTYRHEQIFYYYAVSLSVEYFFSYLGY